MTPSFELADSRSRSVARSSPGHHFADGDTVVSPCAHRARLKLAGLAHKSL